jgi:hypothetical protein
VSLSFKVFKSYEIDLSGYATNQASDQIIRRVLKDLLRWYALLQLFEPVEHDVDLGV